MDMDIPEILFRLKHVFGERCAKLHVDETLSLVQEGYMYTVTRVEMSVRDTLKASSMVAYTDFSADPREPLICERSTRSQEAVVETQSELPSSTPVTIVLPSGHSAKVEGEDWSDAERAARMIEAGDYYAEIGRTDSSPAEWYRCAVETYPTAEGWCRLALELADNVTVVVGEEELHASTCFEKALGFPADSLRANDCLALGECFTTVPNLINCAAACDLFKRAVVLDATLAAAWSGLGATIGNEESVEVNSRRYTGADCCLRAVELDPSFAPGTILGGC